MRAVLTLVCVGSMACGGILAACGGSTSSNLSGSDSGSDGTAAEASSGGMDTGTGNDGQGGGDSGMGSDTGSTGEGGSTCAPPTDPSKSALCLTLTPESIAFTSDPAFDGKGWLIAQVFDTALPDYPDGGSKPPLAAMELPPGLPDGGTIDLSQPVPVLRFDGLPSTVYVRAVFEDNPMPPTAVGAGTWLAGYDLSNGVHSQLALVNQALPTGSGTSINLPLVALRQMIITLDRTVTPAGNGQGPAEVIATPDQSPTSGSPVFGIGTSPCTKVDGTNMGVVPGLVIGKGPYWVAAVLDDFGTSDGGTGLPPGALTSLDLDGGSYQLPAANQLAYAPNAYQVALTVSLNLVVPGAPSMDSVSCP
jgi:hypothetical protein